MRLIWLKFELRMEIHFVSLFVLYFLFRCLATSTAEAFPAMQRAGSRSNGSVSAVYVFGDSTVDPGNNNFIPTTVFRSNFPPYGKDFKDHIPTGRFSNGRLTTDFIASYVGLKEYVPPYLDPTLSIKDIVTGCSFASAGSGYDPFTPKITGTLNIPNQLVYFKEYKQRLAQEIGEKEMKIHITKAFFVVSAGTNDFALNYYTLPIRRKSFTISAYKKFIIQNAMQFIEGLLDEGARYITVVGLPPIGCLPFFITLNSNDPIGQRNCIQQYSSVAQDYNQMLQIQLNFLMTKFAPVSLKIVYIDSFNVAIDVIQNHEKYGIDEVSCGCCGSGAIETSILCNSKSPVCSDASKYMFFDSVHPTEKVYYRAFHVFAQVIDNLFYTNT